MKMRVFLIGLLASAVGSGAAMAQQVVGAAERVHRGTVQTVAAQTDGLSVGDAVFQQARLNTDDTGSGLVRFQDGTALTVAESSNVLIDEFIYNPGGRQSLVLRLGVGAMRMVSGQIAKEAVDVRTPVAVIGIRGTDFTLDTRLPNLLRMWLEEGAITITAADSGLVFEYEAPARADCTPIACRPLPFNEPPRAFRFASGQGTQDDDTNPFDRGGGEGNGNGGTGRN